MFRLLLLATLSVPSATRTPCFRAAASGSTPLASLRLDLGQVATVTPFSASSAKSSSCAHTQCAAMAGISNRPQSAR